MFDGQIAGSDGNISERGGGGTLEPGERPGVFIISDAPSRVARVAAGLRDRRYEVLLSPSDKALDDSRLRLASLVLIDRDLHHRSSLQLCHAIRRHPRTSRVAAVIFTASDEQAFTLDGLAAGADVSLGAPVSVHELLLRAERLTRRRDEQDGGRQLLSGDIELDEGCQRAWRRGRVVDLGATELRLLRELMMKVGQPVTRQELATALGLGCEESRSRKIDWYVSRVRRALRAGGGFDPIETVRSLGYKLVETQEKD